MEPFNIALNFTLKWEGGLVEDPDDPGGLTNFGISKRANPDLDIKNLTREIAADIYFKRYWIPASCENNTPPVAISIFDFAVNSGVSYATFVLRGLSSGLDAQSAAMWICSRRLMHLASLNTADKFLKGWVNRVADLMSLVSHL